MQVHYVSQTCRPSDPYLFRPFHISIKVPRNHMQGLCQLDQYCNCSRSDILHPLSCKLVSSDANIYAGITVQLMHCFIIILVIPLSLLHPSNCQVRQLLTQYSRRGTMPPHKEQPNMPFRCTETTTRAPADWASIETVIDQMFWILCHVNLSHQLHISTLESQWLMCCFIIISVIPLPVLLPPSNYQVRLPTQHSRRGTMPPHHWCAQTLYFVWNRALRYPHKTYQIWHKLASHFFLCFLSMPCQPTEIM